MPINKGRKITGGRYHAQRKRTLIERTVQERHVVLGDLRTKELRKKGGSMKTIILKADTVNLIVDGKAKQAKILNVIETPQNRFFARQNRLMKSAIIETSLGKARITNRPSQEGCVNAILIK